ncbi:hypothetical protein [Burkholderia gladioli]|uniref:hypothetical protein n=1 Tax=Burkholderia gladioli TaxID=28095 RepID=UPI001640C85C|nr:hypothetical protein [Burkholderia gladioli]
MTVEHEKIPAQGGEMPPGERAASTGGRGIDTVLGAAPAGNAAQKRNITAALTDDEREQLIDLVDRLIRNPDAVTAKDCIIGNDVRTVQWIAEHTRALLTSPRAADSPRGTSAQIQLERKLTCEAIDGVMASGYQNRYPPPSDEHWLAGFWKIGRSFFGAEFALRFIRDQLNEYLDGVPLDEASKKLRDVAQSAIDDFSVNPIVSIDLQAYMPECWIDIARRAAPAAPVAEPAPDPLRRRVERLLVELHAEGRLSEGQCVRVLDIPREDWRELAEFLSSATQAVAADGAPADEPSEIEQVIACLGDDAAKLREANPDDEMADNMEAAARLLSERAALSPAPVDEAAQDEQALLDEALSNHGYGHASVDGRERHHFKKGFKARAAVSPATARKSCMCSGLGPCERRTDGSCRVSAPADARDAATFIREVAAQKPEKPDYWSSCGQCQRNAERAQDLLDAACAQSIDLPDSEGGEA